MFLKLEGKEQCNYKTYLYAFLFGLSIVAANAIRPAMAVFIIAIVIYYLLNIKNIKRFIILGIILLTYFIGNFAINLYNENGIGVESRSGALGWSVFFGANYEHDGGWSVEDAEKVFGEILPNTDEGNSVLVELAIERYQDMGPMQAARLWDSKFGILWSANNGNAQFLGMLITEDSRLHIYDYLEVTDKISDIIVISILLLVCLYALIQFKRREETNLLFELFVIGYIIANLIIVLNVRYNFPIYPILIYIAIQSAERIMPKKKVEDSRREKTPIEDPKVLLIIPAYNEESNIKKTCESIKKQDANLDFVVINDCSTDDTARICEENGYNYINNVFNLGIGGAVQTGYKYAYKNGYDIAIQFDGDGQHDITCVQKLIQPIKEGQADFVIGSRFIDGTSKFKSTRARRFGIRIISCLINFFTDTNVTDPTSGFRAANKKVIKLFAKEYPVEYPEPEVIMTLIRNNYVVTEVPVMMHEREGGISSITSWKSAYYMINVAFSIFIANIRRKKDGR